MLGAAAQEAGGYTLKIRSRLTGLPEQVARERESGIRSIAGTVCADTSSSETIAIKWSRFGFSIDKFGGFAFYEVQHDEVRKLKFRRNVCSEEW